MKKYLLMALALVVSASFNTADAAKKKTKDKEPVAAIAPDSLVTAADSISYAVGMSIGMQMMQMGATDLKADKMTQGIQAMFGGGEKKFAEHDMQQMVMKYFTQKEQEKTEQLIAAGKAFLAANAKNDSVITTPSGLQYIVLKQGNGQVPQLTDKVKVHYEGRLIDGTVFDASAKHGTEPVAFQPNQVIKGWKEALTMMPVGSKWRLFIPQELGYGSRPAGQIPPYSTLIFDVELVGIDK